MYAWVSWVKVINTTNVNFGHEGKHFGEILFHIQTFPMEGSWRCRLNNTDNSADLNVPLNL